jgi:predicted DCC family thiol-disulfide oxidoreductase YuxK
MVLIYDGDCAFCRRCVDLGARVLPDPVRCEPYQLVDLGELGLTLEQVTTALWWVAAGHRARSGHRAVAALLRSQSPWWWRALGWVIDRPPISFLAAWVYAVVARNRHRLPGGTAQCRLPSAAEPRGLWKT